MRSEPGLSGIFSTESLSAGVDCTQCPNVAANPSGISQTGKLDITREVFPWLEIAIGKYTFLSG
jgi:hypothetical protein